MKFISQVGMYNPVFFVLSIKYMLKLHDQKGSRQDVNNL